MKQQITLTEAVSEIRTLFESPLGAAEGSYCDGYNAGVSDALAVLSRIEEGQLQPSSQQVKEGVE